MRGLRDVVVSRGQVRDFIFIHILIVLLPVRLGTKPIVCGVRAL